MDANVSQETHRKTCACGAPRRPSGHDCLACHAEYERRERPLRRTTHEQRRRANARSYALVYLKRGKIERTPCACGGPGEIMRHRNYDDPLDVWFQCRECFLGRGPERNEA